MSAKKKKGDATRSKPIATPQVKEKRSAKLGVYCFYLFALLVSSIPLVVVLCWHWSLWLVIVSAAYLLLALLCARIAPQWERVVVLRLGRFSRIEGPGIFFIIPFLESASLHVDQRVLVTPFSAEEALTADLVPTDIDAVLFWMVVDPEKAWCEVKSYPYAVLYSAQTALRDAIGRINLVDISTRRSQLDLELKEILNEKTSDWGISIISVEIRNILIPKALQDAMSREAQAQQESSARLILAEIENQIAELLVDAGKTYHEDEIAFQIRMASMVNESVKESSNGLIVVPSAFSEGFNAGDIEALKNLFKK